jgi:hypothetical protein
VLGIGGVWWGGSVMGVGGVGGVGGGGGGGKEVGGWMQR